VDSGRGAPAIPIRAAFDCASGNPGERLVYSLRKPSDGEIRAFLAAQKDQPFSYAHVGASKQRPPRGYTADHNRVRLGEGPEVFERAKKAIREWKMFAMPWIRLCWPDTPIKEDATVAVLVSHAGFWSLNAARIVYVLEENGADKKFGFAYGTLLEHGERGEERFTVEHHAKDQSVWYDVCAFSKPNLFASLGYPFARYLQKRFARDSLNAMLTATNDFPI
jgi:uncharacterized protein (UPF0548 family)